MRARGFTLIELTVVVTILGLTAAVVAPRVVAMRDAGVSRETAAKIVAGVESAREVARSRGERIVVGLDPDDSSLSIAGADEEAENRLDTSLRIPGSFTVTSVDRTATLGQEANAASGETLGVFFEDGTAEPSTAELTVGGQARTLRIAADGTVTFGADLAPAEETEKWQAGDLENRA